MKLKILDANKNEKGSRELPAVFGEAYRPDLIKRAVESLQTTARQPYGADPRAGKKCSAELSRRRRKYRGSYGHGISRVPRKIHSRNGVRFNWTGAFAPGTVGGRRAHAPKALKIWARKLNIKERRKAIRSAIAATVMAENVSARGHVPPEGYPFMITDDFESIKKTKDVVAALKKLGMDKELDRASERKYRAGIARLRGRKYRKRKGPLLVVSDTCPLLKAAANIPGVEAVTVDALNAELLAPGAEPARLTLFTQAAVERLDKERLYYDKTRKAKTAEQDTAKKPEKTPAKKPSKKVAAA